jgi:wyosine [tRNA(Phe)-imidazoG37] synthetase (radical SAM superfamily)
VRDKEKESEIFSNESTVYGPVTSWRYGQSLGIDPIFKTSTCSFNCIYCQLGEIQDVTRALKTYVETKRVITDFKKLWDSGVKIDVATFSGSGEPTLAANLGEMAKGIKAIAKDMPLLVLTNATELHRPEVVANLAHVDRVILKIDACDEKTFKLINRPADGVTLASVLAGITELKKHFKGHIEVQSMFMPLNAKHLEDFAKILVAVNPELVQLNTPKRPYPTEWHRENRGNHKEIFDYETRRLKTVDQTQAKTIEEELVRLTGLSVHSIYR